MNPEQIAAQLAGRTAALKAAAVGAGEPLMRRARTIASTVRVEAARNGHPIGIRLVERRGGLRLTVSGPHAARYAKMIGSQLDRELPDLKAEIRSQIKGKSR